MELMGTMALEVKWYDFVCFVIVALAFIGALWVLWRKEGASKSDYNTMYESLLLSRPQNEVVVNVLPRGHVSTSQLWTVCWRGVHPLWLFGTRLLSFVILAGFLSWDVVDWNASIFIYYTEWTFTLVMLYFLLGSIVSAYGCWLLFKKPPTFNNRERVEFLKRDLEESISASPSSYREKETKNSIKLQNHYAEEEFQQRAGFWGYLLQTTYQTCAGAVILTDIVFWCVIVPFLSNSHLGLNVLMGCMHTLNAVFLLLDTALNNLPFPWFRIAYFVLWSCGYVIFQWVIHACGFTWWPYPFLELGDSWAPLWYFGLAVIHIPCYGMYALVVKTKITILPRLFPNAFLRSY
ncbi:putative Transmembrane protein [Quillaja saponaria]|uniref:Transmembrane protein n=1 Tax=Quillaja saponaria TaxID=32244 RepID=A0AAD7VEX8_QUISA|nr:putative Transmembrane protein [Quillaja saponaria]